MSDIYTSSAEMADEMLFEFQQGTVTTTRFMVGEPDPDAPYDPPPVTPQTIALTACVMPVAKRFINGTTIVGTESQIVYPASQGTPKLSDIFTVDGETRQAISIRRLPEAGLASVYFVIVSAK